MPQKAIMVLAVALVVSSLILSFTVVTSADTLSKGLAKIQITAGSGSGTGSGTLQPTATPAPQVDFTQLIQSFAGAEGSETAPVTIVEFSDYQCPFCRSFYNSTLPQLRREYVDTGKVRFIYKDFPLSFHPQARRYAEAARCAGDQGKYFDMHDKIFQEQEKLGQGTVDVPFDKQWAADLGLDTTAFDTCLDSGKYAQAVQQDFADGVAVGVSGTPTFFVNGQQIVGAQPYSVFKQAIDAELAG